MVLFVVSATGYKAMLPLNAHDVAEVSCEALGFVTRALM
jgi:hypothetical protein